MAVGTLLVQSIVSVLLLLVQSKNRKNLADPALLKSGQSCRNYGAVLIDVENVRGKSAFRLSYSDVMRAVSLWSSHVPDLRGKIVLVMDHGSSPSSFWLPSEGFSVLFSGPLAKADDVIALDAVPFLVGRHVNASCCVVTADRGLVQRCHRVVSSGKKNVLSIMNPLWLLQDLELLLKGQATDADSVAPLGPSSSSTDWEMQVGLELLEAHVQLRACVIRNKRRKECKLKVAAMEAKLPPSTVTRIRTVLLPLLLDRESLSSTGSADSSEKLSGHLSSHELAMLTRARNAMVTSQSFRPKRSPDEADSQGGRERTRDRATRAEQLRQNLEETYEGHTAAVEGTVGVDKKGCAPPALSLVQWRTNTFQNTGNLEGSESTPHSLKIVVLSNTNGNELQMGGSLPMGDVLLHLGGFTPLPTNPLHSDSKPRGPRRQLKMEALGGFDQWLAQQPHRHKIILRGRDDPRQAVFPESQAQFVGQPMQKDIDGLRFALAPFVGSGLTNRCLPTDAVDVIATYMPPLDMLDGTNKGSGGSAVLRRGLNRMVERKSAPVLVLCGHIGESRGALRYQDILVVNAANGNPLYVTGKAEYRPAIVQVNCTSVNPRQRSVELVQMDRQYDYLNRLDNGRFFSLSESIPGEKKLLLAVDLGLRTGLSLFDDAGKLLRYDDRQFSSADDLKQGAASLLSTWEAEAQARISHVTIEGHDHDLLSLWCEVVGSRPVLVVPPEHWRHDMLTPKDCESWRASKDASNLAARDVIERFGSDELDRKEYSTDCAESLLLGAHVAQRLGWIRRDVPVIRA